MLPVDLEAAAQRDSRCAWDTVRLGRPAEMVKLVARTRDWRASSVSLGMYSLLF